MYLSSIVKSTKTMKRDREIITENGSEAEFSHIPVLLEECLDGLNIKPDGTYVDGTLGGAGHSSEILKRLGTGGLLIGIDQDEEAIKAAGEKLSVVQSEGSYVIIKSNFSMIQKVVEKTTEEQGRPEGADGILLDLGVSSHQLDTPERGFSYRFDSPLDMRMDKDAELTAATVVNEYSEKELTKILRDYSEEKWAARIAQMIVKNRVQKPIMTTFELVDIIKAAIPAKARAEGGHPAKRTFQAIRIEVNQELAVLEKTIDAAIDTLREGGRLCIITFHSLEDRIVKNKFREAMNPCTCPHDFPICVCGKKSKGKVLTSKPIIATNQELAANNRSHSAKLRIFEKRESK